MKLSKNFTLEELCFSETAIRKEICNQPSDENISNLKKLVESILQPLRCAVGPIIVTSGYRCAQLNREIGGSISSAHIDGRAVDIKAIEKNPKEIAEFIEEHFLYSVDQVILEFDRWVHVSISEPPRNQVLTAKKINNKTVYINGIIG